MKAEIRTWGGAVQVKPPMNTRREFKDYGGPFSCGAEGRDRSAELQNDLDLLEVQQHG